MTQEGKLILFTFPQADQSLGKLRPALVLRQCPSQYDDWLICMISSQTFQQVDGIDEIIAESDNDFGLTGLKTSSVIRLTRLAVVERASFVGILGTIPNERLERLQQKLAAWLTHKN